MIGVVVILNDIEYLDRLIPVGTVVEGVSRLADNAVRVVYHDGRDLKHADVVPRAYRYAVSAALDVDESLDEGIPIGSITLDEERVGGDGWGCNITICIIIVAWS